MIIGNGLIAVRFEKYSDNENFIIFASGVSNSKNTDPAAYERERNLLLATMLQHTTKTLVYFSTCSINDPEEKDSMYVLHKKSLEELIQKTQANYHIFRVSNLVGKTSNQNTILNFFIQHINNGDHFNLWTGAVRNLIDVDDMYAIADHILTKSLFRNSIINIANPESYKVTAIVNAIESTSKLKANCTLIQKGEIFNIDTSLITPIINKLHLSFGKDYLFNLLSKYYYH